MTLTEKQRAALRHIADERVHYQRFGYGAWRITGPSHPSVVGRVISLGMAQWAKCPNTSDAKVATLTARGRVSLAESH